MKTVFEQAIETGDTTFPRIWQAIQRMVADGADHESVQATLRDRLQSRCPSAQFWQWLEDAVAAAKQRGAIEADRRRREFCLVKGDNR